MRSLIASVLLMAACGNNTEVPPAHVGSAKPPQHDEHLLQENKLIAEHETREIDEWITRQGVPMERTGTGVRIKLVRDVPGENARAGQNASIAFTLSLLNGTQCYASKPGEPESFRIEHADVESGLHEAIQLLSPGDSAVIVIPSYRAFGLAGDQDKVPMHSAVVYHLGLVKVSD